MRLQEKVAKRIHALRLSKSMTQEQLAEKANMDVSMLARIERGSRGDIRMSTLERIVSGLDVSYQEFIKKPPVLCKCTRLAAFMCAEFKQCSSYGDWSETQSALFT